MVSDTKPNRLSQTWAGLQANPARHYWLPAEQQKHRQANAYRHLREGHGIGRLRERVAAGQRPQAGTQGG